MVLASLKHESFGYIIAFGEVRTSAIPTCPSEIRFAELL